MRQRIGEQSLMQQGAVTRYGARVLIIERRLVSPRSEARDLRRYSVDLLKPAEDPSSLRSRDDSV